MPIPCLSRPAARAAAAIALFLALFTANNLRLHAQDDMSTSSASAAHLTEPDYVGQVEALGLNGALIPLEKEKLYQQTKTKNYVFAGKVQSVTFVDGASSPVRLPAGSQFVVRISAESQHVDPSSLFKLIPMTPGKNDREILGDSSTIVAYLSPKEKIARDPSLPLNFEKYGPDSLRITPQSPLPPGEYVFYTTGGPLEGYCFGVDAGSAGALAPATAPAPAAAPPQPPQAAWRIHPPSQTAGPLAQTVTLLGTATAGAQQGPAQLSFTCNQFPQNPSNPPGMDMSVKVFRELVSFPVTDLSCEGDGAENAHLYTQVGSSAEQYGSLCYDNGDLPADPRAVIEFGIGSDALEPGAVFASAGSEVRLSFRVRNAQQTDLAADFHLPADDQQARAALQPCLLALAQQKQQAAAAVVSACPDVPGEQLEDMAILTGAAMKPLAADPDNDVGTVWNLPKTRVRPRLSMACFYAPPGVPKPDRKAMERRLVPVPAAAKECVFRDYRQDQRYGHCKK